MRGTTFVYDPEADRYVAAPERSGAPLTGEEMQALGQIMGLTEQVFRLFSALMDPADDLIRLGIAL